MTKSGITWCLNSDVWASLLCNMLCVREKKKKKHGHNEKKRGTKTLYTTHATL